MSLFVPDRPWDEIGSDISDKVSVEEALRESGAGFSVNVIPAGFKEGEKFYPASDYNFIVRTDTLDVLGVCKQRFVPIQNYIMVDIVQPLIDNSSAKLDTIGVFGNGEKVWMLVKLPKYTYEIVTEDSIELYLLLINGHDGSTSIMVGLIPFRIACTNQLPNVGRYMIRFKHTESAEEMIAFFKLKIRNYLNQFESYAQDLRLLAARPVSLATVDDYFRQVLNLTGELSTRQQNILEKLHSMYTSGRGSKLVTGTWYGAFNTITEYLSYEVGRSQETRLNSLWFGKNNEINYQALRLALKKIT